LLKRVSDVQGQSLDLSDVETDMTTLLNLLTAEQTRLAGIAKNLARE
jgi:hypothetical protein